MAGKEKQDKGVTGYQLNGREGWQQLRTLEDTKAIEAEDRYGIEFVQYEFQPLEKGTEVTIILDMGDPGSARKAEWNGFLAVKRRHASIYGESRMAMKTSTGYRVYVRWMVWANQGQPPASDNISF